MDGVLGQDPADLTDEELRADVLRLRRRMDRLDAAFATRVQAANRRAVGLVDGHQSTPAWISWTTGMYRPAVTKAFRHADVAELLPDTGAAWRDGRITTTAVDMIAGCKTSTRNSRRWSRSCWNARCVATTSA